MENKLNFIVLPKEDSILSETEASMLLGGDLCRKFIICIDGHGSYCEIHTTEQCSGGTNDGGCGETMFCEEHGKIPMCRFLYQGCPEMN